MGISDKKTNGVVMKVGAPQKKQQKPVPTGKWKQTLYLEKHTRAERGQDSEEDTSHKAEQLQKRPKCTATDKLSVARTLNFEELEVSPSHYSAHSTSTTSPHQICPFPHPNPLSNLSLPSNKLLPARPFFNPFPIINQLNPHEKDS